MAADVLTVLLEGKPIGNVERLANGALRLHFDGDYRDDPTATLLSVSMPPAEEVYGDARLTPWLWGLLPDNADVLARWGRDFGVSVASPFPLLGTHVGHDCAGAVQFCAPDEVDDLVGRQGAVTWLTEADIASRLRTLRADSTSWLGPGFTGQFSLGGAQAKTALHHGPANGAHEAQGGGGRWGAPTGSVPTTHILKPAVAGFEAQNINEHLCLTAARELGLSAAKTRIETFADESAIVVERFDRTTRDGALVRVHQEDLCQALSVSPARKYQSDGGPTPGQIAELIRSTIPGPDAEIDVWRFADALAFNWLIAGTDAHAKNYGLLLAGNQIRLGPLYDIASILPYDDSEGYKLKLAMKVGDDYELSRTDRRSAWEHAADELKLDRDRLISRVLELAERTPAAFVQATNDDGVGELSTDLPDRLVALVSERSDRCAAALT
ncbi:MAG: type II toxin-antitoxin system HipA family toxin [Actinomycetia bacterium]|nr:type II toxin-antitoxin system HipA family toxin [Actinomycetes bacterium]